MPARGRKAADAPHDVRLLRHAASDGTPLHVQVSAQLRANIQRGVLRPGARLPSARTLAADLRVSRNTVDAAFAQLRAEGLIERRVGAGTVVSATISQVSPSVEPSRTAAVRRVTAVAETRRLGESLSARGALVAALGAAEMARDLHAAPCATDVRGFPSGTWNALLSQHVRRAGVDLLRSVDPVGLPELRQAIAQQAQLTRGVRCAADQVVVVNSTQQAIDLAARLLLDPGSVAATEDPCYPSARSALLASGARVAPIPVDDDGIQVRRLAAAPDVRLVYVTPSHQYPLGVTLSLARRQSLLSWAASAQAWIIEDDYDSVFQYGDRPMQSLQGMDVADRVLYVGSYNTLIFPGLRLAYLILPAALVDAFAAARRITDGFSSPLLQGVLAEFLSRGHFASYVSAARSHYEASRDLLLAAIAQHWSPAVRLGPSETGLHLVAHLGEDADDRRIVRGASAGGLGVAALSAHCHGTVARQGLLLSFGAATARDIEVGVASLAAAVRAG